jgi:hypothetical protein
LQILVSEDANHVGVTILEITVSKTKDKMLKSFQCPINSFGMAGFCFY